MIVTELYDGQGLGNQLWCYVTTRVIAKDQGFDFGIQSPGKFKGRDFMDLDFGRPVVGGSGQEGGPPTSLPDGITHYYREREIRHPENNVDIRMFDEKLVSVPDGTKIDGIMQDEQYIKHRKGEIARWLAVKPAFDSKEFASDDTCIINFRGGEYTRNAAVFLPQSYWNNAVRIIRSRNPEMKFIVVTDDVATAKKFFPTFDVFHFGIGKDYAVIKNAHYLILSNSSFAWFPAWLSTNLKFCIAPKYWSQYNRSDGYWGCMYNITRGWHYLDRDGQLHDDELCLREQRAYMEAHRDFFEPARIVNNFLVISNYHNDLTWVPEYTDNYLVYDRSESEVYPSSLDRSKVRKHPNIGYNIYDYCTYIIDHYEALPDCVIFTKGNVFPRHVPQATFRRLMNNDFFTPIEDFHMHRPEWPIAFFASDGGFCEINNSWYLQHHVTKYFHDYNDFLRYCFQDPVIPRYIRFAPGGCYVVPRANILKLPRVFYENLRTFVSHCQLPGEAHIIERSLHTLWTANFPINPTMEKPIDASFMPTPKNHKPSRRSLGRLVIAAIRTLIRGGKS